MSWMLDKKVKRELPGQWKGVVPTGVFVQEATRIVEEAGNKGIPLRILGGLGVSIHCKEFRDFANNLGRVGTGVVRGQEYSDIDFISYRKHRNKIKDFFVEQRYAKRKTTLSSAASERQIYFHPKGWFYVDVFYDKLLVANHQVDFKGRLELDYPTISVTDMLLEKIQMWEAFGVKDLKDCILLLRAHTVEENGGREGINARYIAKLLAGNWGFWYTATTNLNRIMKFISMIDKLGIEAEINPKVLEQEIRDEIVEKIEALLGRINREPKSFKWKLRSKAGTKKQWYNPVEREDTVGGFQIWEAILQKG